jgi:predicted metal-dependent hydrolase
MPPFSPTAPGGPDSESELIADPRLQEAISLFNAAEWYACHDGLEELWHETAGPLRPVLQGLLQIAVAHLHLERGNGRGATVLLGEGLGRLRGCDPSALGLDLASLQAFSRARLEALQGGLPVDHLPLPRLDPAPTPGA